jgi:hypothetical protein
VCTSGSTSSFLLSSTREAVLFLKVPLPAHLSIELALPVLFTLSHHLLTTLAFCLLFLGQCLLFCPLFLSKSLLAFHILLLHDGFPSLEVALVSLGTSMSALACFILNAHVGKLRIQLLFCQARTGRATSQASIAAHSMCRFLFGLSGCGSRS